jgi:hypothetical protein
MNTTAPKKIRFTQSLNGWERLLVVFSVLLFVVVMWFAVQLMPSDEAIKNRRLSESIDLVGNYRLKNKEIAEYQGSSFVRYQFYKDLTDDQILNELHLRWGNKVDFSPIDKKYEAEVANLPLQKAKTLGVGFILWLFTVAVIYVFGVGVAWVIRGFRQKA